jgi:DNA-binding transcriptional ArsR family regulator
VEISDLTGDDLLRVLATLANPHRLRIVAALSQERNYVSKLARELEISRALLQVHLRKLRVLPGNALRAAPDPAGDHGRGADPGRG